MKFGQFDPYVICFPPKVFVNPLSPPEPNQGGAALTTNPQAKEGFLFL